MDQFENEMEDELFGPIGDDVAEESNASEELTFEETVNPEEVKDDIDDGFESEDSDDSDYMSEYLKGFGINKNKVKMTDEFGQISEVPFDSLTKDEKIEILKAANESPITDSELEILNYLRSNNLDLNSFAQWQREEAIQDYINKNQKSNYTVDQISDDELYKFDLVEKFSGITDEEAEQELEQAKQNPALFEKKIKALRDEYTALEQQQLEAEQQQAQQQRENQFNETAQYLVDSMRQIDDLHGLEIENQDKEAILSFLLDRDANGQSGFYKLFSDPNALIRHAWYELYGDQAFQSINDYYKSVIEQSRRNTNPVKAVNKKIKNNEPDPYDLNDVFNS